MKKFARRFCSSALDSFDAIDEAIVDGTVVTTGDCVDVLGDATGSFLNVGVGVRAAVVRDDDSSGVFERGRTLELEI